MPKLFGSSTAPDPEAAPRNPTQRIRTFGDPVLTSMAEDVTEIDGTLARVCGDMLDTMYDAPGVGLAAPQVGIRRRFFVYDHGEGPGVLINPVIVESDGEYVMEEGCLSVPGLSWEIVRPNRIHVTGWDIGGREVSIEAEEFVGRLIQHEIDHLNGRLLLDELDDDQRKAALRVMRDRAMEAAARTGAPAPTDTPGLSLP